MSSLTFKHSTLDLVVTMFFVGFDANRFAISGNDDHDAVTDAELESMADMRLPEGWIEA